MNIHKKMKAVLIFAIVVLFFLLVTKSFGTTAKATDDLKLRKETSTDSIILEIIPKEDTFEILEEDGDWYRVNYKKIKGYVKKEYVELVEDTKSEKQTSENEITNNTQENKQENTEEETNKPEEQQNSTENRVEKGDTIRLTQELSLKIRPLFTSLEISQLQEGEQITILQIMNQWAYVSKENQTGWVIASGLTKEEKAPAEEENKPEEKEEDEEEPKQETKQINKPGYITSDGINFRQEASTDSKVLKTFLQNAQVTILEEQGDWYKVDYKGQTGYIIKTYVSTKKVEVTSRSQEERKPQQEQEQQEVVPVKKETATSSAKAQDVVSTAKQYLGCAYVYGASGPKSFDCSGFTMFIYKKFGVSLPHSATAQSKKGSKVEKQNLQPGDLVFFSDYKTYTGIGHCGIYIGDGKFIHASTEKTGVITSSLNSGSYQKRYVTATRLL